MKIPCKKLHPDAILPTYSKAGDAGMDVYALEDFIIYPNVTRMVRTGIAMAIPNGYFGSARERSGLAVKGMRLGGGVIDSGYRGEIQGILTNLGAQAYYGKQGDRIFQIIIQPCATIFDFDLALCDELPESDRGAAGFGSTGT